MLTSMMPSPIDRFRRLAQHHQQADQGKCNPCSSNVDGDPQEGHGALLASIWNAVRADRVERPSVLIGCQQCDRDARKRTEGYRRSQLAPVALTGPETARGYANRDREKKPSAGALYDRVVLDETKPAGRLIQRQECRDRHGRRAFEGEPQCELVSWLHLAADHKELAAEHAEIVVAE